MLDGREVFRDEVGMILRVENDSGFEQDDPTSFTASELKAEFHEIGSQTLCSCGSKLNPLDHINFVSAAKKFSEEFKSSHPIYMSGRRASLYDIPSNLCSSEISFKTLKYHRRTRSINDLGGFIFECPAVRSENLDTSPSVKWILDSIERTLLKSSLFFQLGAIDGNKSHPIVRSMKHWQTKAFELTCSPTGLHNTSLQKSKADKILNGKQRSELVIPEKMLISCSSTNSTSSYHSTSYRQSSFSKGLLHCIKKSGKPYFVFSVDDDLGDVYVSNPQIFESSVDKLLDYMYLFHARKAIKKNPRNHGNSKLDYVGKMKVSSSLVLNSNLSKLMETEFVLVGASENHAVEMQSSSSTLTKSKGLAKKVAEIFRPSQLFKHDSTQKMGKIGELSSVSDESLPETFFCELCDSNHLDSMSHLDNDFPANLELAAIVVQDHQLDSNAETTVGGWGLKFLEKARDDNSSQKNLFSYENIKESYHRNGREYGRHVNILVPAGIHGSPSSTSGGPSSLTDRWRSGGQCDCGGWDIGCPLTILRSTSDYSTTLTQEKPQEDSKSVTLFTQGAREGELVLRIVNMDEGLYYIYFQSTLSALQSFSIAVAIIHTQTPSLYPKL